MFLFFGSVASMASVSNDDLYRLSSKYHRLCESMSKNMDNVDHVNDNAEDGTSPLDACQRNLKSIKKIISKFPPSMWSSETFKSKEDIVDSMLQNYS